MARILTRDEEAALAEETRDRRVAPVAPPLLALQRAAGNRAVSALVQRDETAGGGVSWTPFPMAPPRAPNLNLPPTSRLATGNAPPTLTEDAAAKVRAYLEGRRYEIGSKVSDGAISMPEVVQAVRESVPEAVSAPVAEIEKQVRAVFGGISPPPSAASGRHRGPARRSRRGSPTPFPRPPSCAWTSPRGRSP